MTECKEGYNPVTRPAHYVQTEVTPIDVIEAWAPSWPSGIAPHVANVVKYACRFSSKGSPIEDLKKMAWYAQRAVEVLERAPPLKSWRELAGTDSPEKPEPIPADTEPGEEPPPDVVTYNEGGDLDPAPRDGLLCGDYVEVTIGPTALPPGSRDLYHRKGTRGWVCVPKEGDKRGAVLVRTSADPDSERYAVAVRLIEGVS